ncbi:hypothetical protein PR202_gb26840 [Eleusine coracana subsp. coracana]|uniref:Uncharacterized protein n=1 Tax=Eleusine coracana subsp. coracana TaxID=191504 RepID=A0AAV5FSA8_ELECO|nr:hypothetical protein PR202_gb26840 [Eleusine coracana subsp. coracana]
MWFPEEVSHELETNSVRVILGRLVLMSATVDITRYKEYFRDIGRGERVEVIAIPCSPHTSIFQRKVLYLDQIADILNINPQSLSTKYCNGPDASADADLNSDVYELIHKLLLHIHHSEPDISKSILVFLPTYYALEQQWIRLLPLGSTFKVHILHRSIDTDEALQTMKVSKSYRKVILATNIAESSVTIPGVAYVIDSCRSLQVYWDPIRKTDAAGLVWISQSQAEQRKGRTGRTCDGQIYRLVTGNFYRSLNDHEYPAILRLSLREQVLMVCCAEPRSMNDPSVLLQRALSPPDPDAIEDAIESLVQIRALTKTSGRYEPTFYGCLLNSLPLSFDSSVLALKFGELGLLHEGILISIMLDIQPLPILQPFGYQALVCFNCVIIPSSVRNILIVILLSVLQRQKYVDKYFKESASIQIGKKEATTIGNFVRFNFGNVCLRPSFLVKIDPPKYFQPFKFNHTCLLELEDKEALSLEAGNSHCDSQKCATPPYVSQTDFGTASIVGTLNALVKEVKMQHIQEKTIPDRAPIPNVAPVPIRRPAPNYGPVSNCGLQHGAYGQPALETEICVFFANGSCNKGTSCRFSHSSSAPKPVCKFFLTLQVLLQKFLQRMSIKILSEPLFDLQAERMARECFFVLSESFMFDEATLGWFSDISRHPRGMQVSAPVVYVFSMHRPTVTQFGDYPAELRKALRRD